MWREADLGAVFRHQMSAPLSIDLAGLDPHLARKIGLLSDAHGLLLKSFADLLYHPNPPVELLQLTKAFAKANLEQPDTTLPADLASALYYLSIAAALVRHQVQISTLTTAELREGLAWLRQRKWLESRARELAGQALSQLA